MLAVIGVSIIAGALFFLRTTLRELPFNFWVVNTMEIAERLAFFGARAVLPLYMVASATQHGLGISYAEKGAIFGIWAAFQCLLPIVSGGFTDNFGYKKSLYIAFTLNIAGYTAMAFATGFWTMLGAAIMVGTGTAIFKPPVQGTIARSVTPRNSGVGFGIFYWVVNIGAMLAPMFASSLRGNEENPTWRLVFFACAAITAFNFLPAFFLYREPTTTGEGKSSFTVLKETGTNLLRDRRILYFLLITSGFWLMFMQIWDLLPNFIDEWVDSRDIAPLFRAVLGANALTAAGHVKPELIVNLDAIAIVIFVMPISWFMARFKMIVSLLLGMALATIGFFGAGFFMNGLPVAVMILVFSLGEIICSPKFSEYVGMNAPPDKKALYMGYSNIPFAFGWMAGNFLSGPLYEIFASRAAFARHYLVKHLGMPVAEIAALKHDDLLPVLAARLGISPAEATKLLWDTYHPWLLWLILAAFGLLSFLGLLWLDRRFRREPPG